MISMKQFLMFTLMTLIHHWGCYGNSGKLPGVMHFNGEVNIGVLVNLHHSYSFERANDVFNFVDISSKIQNCGVINVDAVQQIIAAKWAIDVINNQSLPHELKIGLQLHDTCNEDDLTQEHLFHVISSAREDQNAPTPPLLGMIGIGDPDSLSQTSAALHAFNIPLISASPEHAETLATDDNVLTTAPDMSGQARAIANLAYEMNVKSVALVSSSHKIIQIFLSEATTLGIRVPRILELNHGQENIPQKVESFLRHLTLTGDEDMDRNPTVALIVNSHEAVAIAEHLKHERMDLKPNWLIGSLGLDLKKLSGWKQVFHGGIFVEPHMPELREFKKYFIQSLQKPHSTIKRVISDYKEEMFGCTHNPSKNDGFLMHCDKIPDYEIELRYQQDPYVSFVVKAVSALTAAFRLAQLDYCAGNVKAECLRHVRDNLHDDILVNLKKLSFSSTDGTSHKTLEVGGTQHHFTRNGRLVANKQLVYVVDRNFGLEKIGWYSEDEGLHLADSLESMFSKDIAVSSPLINQEIKDEAGRSTFARSIDDTDYSQGKRGRIDGKEDLASNPIFSFESFISRTWALVVVSVTIGGFFITLWMLLYVFQKICDGTLPGNQMMGIVLLFGVMMLFASVIPWLLPPNEIICTARHFMHPLMMVLCFSVLLVKSMQLRSLVAVGLGGKIPVTNQIISLVFMVLVQIIISGQWYYMNYPITVKLTGGYPECNVSRSQFILLHLYPSGLLLLSFIYGITVIKIRRNYYEGRWITCATMFIIPIFIAWPLVYHFAPVPFHDPSVAVSVLAVAGVLLSAIFLPKMHTISQQSKLKGEGMDLSRSLSDSTVYTGFSDYVHFTSASGRSSRPTMYPVYGYTTNYFNPPQRLSRNKIVNGAMLLSSPKKSSHKKRKDYVRSTAGTNVKSYTEWSREYSPSISNFDHSSTENLPNEQQRQPKRKIVDDSYQIYQELITDDNNSDSSELDQNNQFNNKNQSSDEDNLEVHPENIWEEEINNHRRRSEARSSRSQLSYTRRHRHSHSPSDGMILTASGLSPSNQDTPQDQSNTHPGYRVSEVFLTH